MTEADANEAERQWAAYHLRQESLQTLQPFGLTEADLKREIALGHTERDALSVLLQTVATETSNLHLRKMAYYSLAICADKEGRPFSELLRQAVRCQLLRFKQSGVRRVAILTSAPSRVCSDCGALANRVLDIDVAMNLMPLPCPTCTGTLFSENPGFCRCSYVPDLSNLDA